MRWCFYVDGLNANTKLSTAAVPSDIPCSHSNVPDDRTRPIRSGKFLATGLERRSACFCGSGTSGFLDQKLYEFHTIGKGVLR